MSVTRVLVAVIVVMLGLAGAAWYGLPPKPVEPLLPSGVQYVDSVAVMPLTNVTNNAELDSVSAGIANEISNHLSRIPALKVISHHSAQAIARQRLTAPELGAILGVRQIIEGSVEAVGENLQITLRQVSTDTGEPVWSETYRRKATDTNAILEDISERAINRLVGTMPGLTLPSFDEHGEPGPGQAAYLSGREWLGNRTAEGLRNAVTEFRKAIRLDPGFAPAYADLSSAYALAVFYRYDIGSDSYTLAAQSLAFAEHAIALDENLAAGYAARGYLGALLGRDADAVAADFERAAELQPNNASIPSWRARSLAQLGQYEEAFAEASRAVDLDPLSPGRHVALAELSLQLGRFDQAIASAKTASVLESGIVRSRAIEGRALLLSGNPQRCAGLPLGPHQVLRATCLKLSGRAAEADAIIERTLADIREKRLQTNGTTDVAVFEDLAVYFAFRGDAEHALFWSAKAYTASPVGLEIRVLESELFDKVREDPKFATSIAAIRANLFERVRRDSEKFR